ncbi:MAG: DUF1801 domain-containing protein [Acidobacteriota bacterium]
MDKRDYNSVDEYIAVQPTAAQQILQKVRSAIRTAAPDAEESISYRMPTYKLNDRPMIYFAGFKAHYSLFAASGHVIAKLKDELAPYEINKHTIRFPYASPVPVKLIKQVAKLRAQEVGERVNAKVAQRKKG